MVFCTRPGACRVRKALEDLLRASVALLPDTDNLYFGPKSCALGDRVFVRYCSSSGLWNVTLPGQSQIERELEREGLSWGKRLEVAN